MAELKAKRLEFSTAVDRAGRVAPAGAAPVELGPGWTAEHLVLAGLVRCSLTSLRHHAGRTGLELTAGGSADGVVTRRQSDGRYAFVEIACRIEAELEPEPPPQEVATLIDKAENGCFVGSSLTAAPTYTWIVNGVQR